MSLLRRWFDPIRSRWFYQKPSRQAVLPTEQGLSIYLRLDDVYSYLAVQQLPQLDELLIAIPFLLINPSLKEMSNMRKKMRVAVFETAFPTEAGVLPLDDYCYRLCGLHSYIDKEYL